MFHTELRSKELHHFALSFVLPIKNSIENIKKIADQETEKQKRTSSSPDGPENEKKKKRIKICAFGKVELNKEM